MKLAFWIVAAELLFAWIVSWSVGHYAGPPVFGYLKLIGSLCLLLGCGALLIQIFKLRWAENPSRLLRQKLIDSRDLWPVVASVIGLCVLQKVALTWVKPALPMANGFWADSYLANADAAMFGADPWIATHFLAGPQNVIIDWLYSAWFPVIVSVLILAAATRSALKNRVILSYFIVFAICIPMQFIVPAAGPLFWERLGLGTRYAAMELPMFTAAQSNYLWIFYQSAREGVAVGISAFPSVHVAMAAWVVLSVKALWPKLFPIALIWYGVILFGSVYLGWHYLLDGIAGTVIALGAWNAGALLCRKSQSSRPAMAGRLWSFFSARLR